MIVHQPASLWRTVALATAALSAACNTPPARGASTPDSDTAVAVPMADPSAATVPVAAAPPVHAEHYTLVLTTTEGSTTTRSSFTLDVSDATPGSVSLVKNVAFGVGSRADVGTKVKGRLTMQGDAPRLEVDAELSSLDAAGKVRRASVHGAAATPPGIATTLVDTTEGGVAIRLTATPAPARELETTTSVGANDAYVLSVQVAHEGAGAPPAPTVLTLTLQGDVPAIAKSTENASLSAADAGASPRQIVGTRVKATAHPRGGVFGVELDLEMSALEPASPAMRVRKIVARGELALPLDKPTVAFAGEDDGHRYTVTITPHRAK